ncbi:MAG: cation:proton antiporter [Brevinematia bacterium]
MPQIDIVTGLFVVFLTSAILLYALGRFEIPFIVSLITAGVILGHFGVIGENQVFKEISDLGIMLMLFFVGVEFSLRTLWNYKKDALIIGLGQIFLSGIPVFVLTFALFGNHKIAFIISTVVAISSTAVIVSLIEKKGAIGTRYGRTSFLVALVQDLVTVVVLIILPFLVGGEELKVDIVWGSLVFVGYTIALYYFTKTKFAEVLVIRDRYLVVFLAVLVSFGSGVVAKFCGLSPFLGAFLGGMIISESFFGRHIASEVLPIKEIFVGFFFIYAGALIKLSSFMANFLTILWVTLTLILFKFIVMFLILIATRESMEHNFRASVLVGNLGEFGLLILSIGLSERVIDERLFVVLSSSIVFSMVISSLLFRLIDKLEYRLPILRLRKRAKRSLGEFDVIIVGFGPVGKKLSEVLRSMNISHVILEMNSETVRKYRDSFNIHFGDAKRENILRWVGTESAKLLVITPPSLDEALFISEKARTLNPNIEIIARVRFSSEMDALKDKGIRNVICDEVSVFDSITGAVLQKVR